MKIARVAAVAWLVATTACGPLETTVRTERGPVLRTFDRARTQPGGLTGTVAVDAKTWPLLRFDFSAYQVCVAETVDELNEETTVERTSRATGPSLSMGLATVVASGLLFLSSLAVSSAPNRDVIDVQGYYGASNRQYVQGAGWVTLGVGVPALVVGLIGLVRSGDETTTKRVEQVARQRETHCGEAAFTGPVVFKGERGERLVQDGVLEVDVRTFAEPVDDVHSFGLAVAFDAASRDRLDAANACIATKGRPVERASGGVGWVCESNRCRSLGLSAQVDANGAGSSGDLASLGDGALDELAERAHACSALDPSRAVFRDALLAEARRRADQQTLAVGSQAAIRSYDDAVHVYAPALTWAAGSKDLEALRTAPLVLTSQSGTLRGFVREAPSARRPDGTTLVGLVEVGETTVCLVVPPRRPWSDELVVGRRVEGVAVADGTCTLGDATYPQLRAVWVRPSFQAP